MSVTLGFFWYSAHGTLVSSDSGLCTLIPCVQLVYYIHGTLVSTDSGHPEYSTKLINIPIPLIAYKNNYLTSTNPENYGTDINCLQNKSTEPKDLPSLSIIKP